MSIRGKVALVTGASRGVGLATARTLVSRGAKVVITARGTERLQSSRDELIRSGGDVQAVGGDVGNWEDAKAMVQTAIDAFGRLDIVVNNAGISMRGHLKELAPETCAAVVQTNLMGCINVSRAAIDHIIDARGHLIFVSSIAGIFGVPGASVYSATKKALTGFAESLRAELGPDGVHVGVIYLGFTEHDPEKRILAADGSLVKPDRPAHNTQAEAGQRIVRMIERRKKMGVLSSIGRTGWLAYRLSPTLVEKAILLAQTSQWGVFRRFS